MAQAQNPNPIVSGGRNHDQDQVQFRARRPLHGKGDAGQGSQDLGGGPQQLPLTIKAYNARWTGRETHTRLDLPNKPPRENQILNAGLGDVIYAREWSDRDVTGFEAIGWFYGTETVRDWRGESRVNLFARVDQNEWPFLEEVGLRTWQQGGEDCTISVVEE